MNTRHTTAHARRRPLRSLLCLLGLAAAAQAQALEGRVAATGFAEPVFVTAPKGDRRVFVVEKGGVIHVLYRRQRAVFLDLSASVDTEGERGLLGMAFDPNHVRNGRFYVNYIDKTTRKTVVKSFSVKRSNPNRADPDSGRLVLEVTQGPNTNHKGGWIGFRPGEPRNLYIATGDGGGSYDPDNNGQNGQVLLGKMLRVDVQGGKGGYAVPADNPFAGSSEVAPEVWALGLRNPFRPSFDRATGHFWIADVGQDTREELNFEAQGDPGGHNYGWRLREGTRATPLVGGNAPGLTEPVFDYPHTGSRSLGSAITGGYVYRGPSLPEADGRYFFGDFVAEKAYSLATTDTGITGPVRDETAALLNGNGLSGLGSFGEDGAGRLYAVGTNGVIVVMCPSSGTQRGADMTALAPAIAARMAHAPAGPTAAVDVADPCAAPAR